MHWLDTEAIPVGRRRLSGADRLVTLLTPDHGRVLAVARGACLPRNRFGSALEPFGASRVVLAATRGEGLYRAESADPLSRLEGLTADLTRCQAAGLACAWARALSREEAGPERYRLLWDTLTALEAPGGEPAAIVAAFLWRMTVLSGVGPRLDACVACGRERPGVALRLEPGGLVCAACRNPGDTPLEPELAAGLVWAAGLSPAPPAEGPARRLAALAQRYLRAHFGRSLP